MYLIKQRVLFLFLFYFLIGTASYATTLVIQPEGDVVGETQFAIAETNETINEIGKRFDVGYYELVRANHQVNVESTLIANSRLIIPSQFILPHVQRKGIVINLAEYRLYYFPENENVVVTFPVGIGRKGWQTPLGVTKIIAKQANPKWRPTEKLQTEAGKNGGFLPDEFPAGPYNPLGKYALRLGWSTFLIHGTNKNDGIGTRVSAGCIRMFPDDIEYLYHSVPVGTQVRVINEPVKVGKQDGSLVLQMHPLLSEGKNTSLQLALQKRLNDFHATHWRNNKMIQSELAHPSGLVRKI